jgi:hypothetical protein
MGPLLGEWLQLSNSPQDRTQPLAQPATPERSALYGERKNEGAGDNAPAHILFLQAAGGDEVMWI